MTNEEMLAEARSAYHQLATGQKQVSIRYGDRGVTYTAANMDSLKQYIAELEDLVGETPKQKRGQPFEVSF